MFCAACGEPTASSPCTACGADPLLRGTWRLDAVLGRGASGTTWAGTRLADGHRVALKELRNVHNPKERELADREARVLRELEHPQLARFEDSFVEGTGKHATRWILQELIQGEDLHQEATHRRYDEAEVRAVIDGLLPVLAYLHSRRPPVIHRDIKPRNVLRRPDGTLVLVDFGSVRDFWGDPDVGASTVAGTFGYMAPESFRGEATPATDLYGVGALAVYLLTRREPGELSARTGELRWAEAVHVSPELRALLARLLDPDPARRTLAPVADEQQWRWVLAAFGAVIILMFGLAWMH